MPSLHMFHSRVWQFALILMGTIVLALGIYAVGQPSKEVSTQPELSAEATASNVAADNTDREQLLQYLIEEEKLAHDVYTLLARTYNIPIFANIADSEITHQNRVASLLETYNIPDPRSAELGVFTDPELQALYTSLIARGEQSLTAAYNVGVLIEERDITDITAQLAKTTESDIVATLEALRNGSENHLRAFTRQLSRD